MNRIKDLIGKKFERLTPIKCVGKNKWNNALWLCKCDCGNEKIIPSHDLIEGKVKSCGCLNMESIVTSNTKHGFCYTRFYRIWAAMKRRCDNSNAKNYHTYGGRNIKYQNSWSEFENFKTDMYSDYMEHVKKYGEKDTTLDRINSNGNYEKLNCRWATEKEQQNNRNNNCLLTYKGSTMTLSETAEKYGIKMKTLWDRLNKHNWDIDRALSTPAKERR